MTRGLTFLFAVASGAAVGNLYWAQPLLDFIARDLRASTSTAGWLVTATQAGYAAGILFIVPLGDVLDRRRLIPIMMLCSAIALVACALAPSIAALLVAICLLGVTTVAGQLLAPLAGDLADDADRGRVVGTVVSGILTGILVSRTISGLIAGAAGWRTVYGTAAVADVLFAIMLYRVIPPLVPEARVPYRELIASVGLVVRRGVQGGCTTAADRCPRRGQLVRWRLLPSSWPHSRATRLCSWSSRSCCSTSPSKR